jgi:hypothetical protein
MQIFFIKYKNIKFSNTWKDKASWGIYTWHQCNGEGQKAFPLRSITRQHHLLSLCFIFIFIFFYLYVHTMFGSFLPPSSSPLPNPPAPSLYPPIPSLPGRNYFALISNFVEELLSLCIEDCGQSKEGRWW